MMAEANMRKSLESGVERNILCVLKQNRSVRNPKGDKEATNVKKSVARRAFSLPGDLPSFGMRIHKTKAAPGQTLCPNFS
jgi:hypothetical protein